MKIANHNITQDGPAFLIAEIGSNHGGSVKTAEDMIISAVNCGAHAVKFQKKRLNHVYTQELLDAPYDNPNSFGATYGSHKRALELSLDDFRRLNDLAHNLNIILFVTPFDPWSADEIEGAINPPVYKISSGDLVNIPLIDHVNAFGKPLIVSTGGGTLEDIDRVVDIVHEDKLAILQCTAAYPCEAADLNLRVIKTLRFVYHKHVIGLSDHYSGYTMTLAAYVLGARIIEKHFTLHHHLKGTDNVFSLEPSGFRRLSRDLARLYDALGSAEKKPLDIEEKPLYKMRKSIYANEDILKGQRMTYNSFRFLSPAGGIEPWEAEYLYGRLAARDIPYGKMIEKEDLK